MNDIRPRLEQALGNTFVFERELGGGGMSRTYLAVESALDRRVVVKVLAPELLAGISVERFRREVLLAAKLQHPHVVPVLSTGEVDGIPWFTMPYVDGDSLRQRLAKGPMGIGESVSALRDVARALVYAHSQGIVHRDIKPDNVLLSSGTATVTDFGIAKAISAARTDSGAQGATLTQVGTSIGTPTYMAPEQALGDPDTDHRADIYAFGVMAYELIAGRPPFQGSNPAKILAAHLSEPAADPRGLAPDCPPALAALVMRCLAKNPDDRPQAANELVRVLESITTSGSGAEVPAILHGGPIRMSRALTLWAVATAIVLLTAWAARSAIGLPDWVLPGAIGVMFAGLPVLAFTAYAQRTAQKAFSSTPHRTPAPQGTMQTLALKASPHLSWRRTWLGGAIAVGAFAALVIGFMVMRAMGIGPMASLRGQGAFGQSETIMVADFGSPASDSTLGSTMAEALRTDLAQSSSLRVISRSAIRDALTRMRVPVDTLLRFEVARQIATREGAKAVLDGSIQQIGQSYVISARLVSALDGNDLAVFREEAESEAELLPALGKLARQVRTKAGESLRAIQASSELDRVTTPSLPALRKYVEGSRVADELGDMERGIQLLREAVVLDTAFAMAWRKLYVLLSNEGRDRPAMLDAISTAYRHRDRLSEMERLLTEGSYFAGGPTPDRRKAIAAFEEAARLDTLSTAGLNNAAVILGEMNDYVKAESLYRRVVQLPNTFGGAFTNLLVAQIYNGNIAALDSTVRLYRETLPESNDLWEADWLAAWGMGEIATADSIAMAVAASPTTLRQAIRSNSGHAVLSELQGRIAESQAALTRRNQALYRVDPSTVNLLQFAIDSAYMSLALGDRTAALAVLERGFARAPLDDIPATERPWGDLQAIGALADEPALVRQSAEGFERDFASQSKDVIGSRAAFATAQAYAEGRWADLIASSREAELRFEMEPRLANTLRGYAFRQLKQADSAIASLERGLAIPAPFAEFDATHRARMLQELGELYEAKGNRQKAIEYYTQFTTLWANGDPELQPRVREIRERVERLRREIG